MKMNTKNIFFIVIIVICVLSLSYGIYFQVFEKNKDDLSNVPNASEHQEVKFDDLFDNQMHYQEYGKNRKFYK